MSLGISSGVNWTREHCRPIAEAMQRGINVFATPGTPSSSTWPRAMKQVIRSAIARFWPRTTWCSAASSCVKGDWVVINPGGSVLHRGRLCLGFFRRIIPGAPHLPRGRRSQLLELFGLLILDEQADVGPLLIRDLQEGVYHHRIKLRALAPLDFLPRHGERSAFAIRPIGVDGVNGVRHREDSRAEDDVPAGDSTGISVPVEALLVLQNDQRGLVQVRHLRQHPVTDLRMKPHLHPFLRRQRPWLMQDGIAHSDLADVVQKRALFDDAQLLVAQSELLADPARVEGNAPRAA